MATTTKFIKDRLSTENETTGAETSQDAEAAPDSETSSDTETSSESQEPAASEPPAENEDQPGSTVVPPASYPEFYPELDPQVEGPGWWDWLFGPEPAESTPAKADNIDAPPPETIRKKIPKKPVTIKLYRGTIGKRRDGKDSNDVYREINLRKFIIESEEDTQRLVTEIQLNGPTPPPTPEADEEDDEETPGRALTIEEVRDDLRELRESKIELTDAHYQRLNEISTEVARLVYSTEKKIQGEVAEVNQVLADYDDGKGPTFEAAWSALEALHKNNEGHVEELHEKLKEPAQRVEQLTRDAAKIADEARPDRESPNSKNADKKDETETGDGDDETGGGDDETGGGEGKEIVDRIPPGKEDSSADGEDSEDEDPNADLKRDIAERLEGLEERLDEPRETTEEDPKPDEPESLMDKLAPLLIAGAAAVGPVAGLFGGFMGPAMANAERQDQLDRMYGDEDDDEDDDKDDASERRDVASAEAQPDGKASPQPGGDPKVANLGGKLVPMNSSAEAEAAQNAFDGKDALEDDVKNSRPVGPEVMADGKVAIAMFDDGEARVAKMPDGQLMMVREKELVQFDPNTPDFRGFRLPNRFDQPPVQVTEAPPPAQTVIV